MTTQEYLEGKRQEALEALLRINRRWLITKHRKRLLMEPLIADYAKYDEYLNQIAEGRRMRDHVDDYLTRLKDKT